MRLLIKVKRFLLNGDGDSLPSGLMGIFAILLVPFCFNHLEVSKLEMMLVITCLLAGSGVAFVLAWSGMNRDESESEKTEVELTAVDKIVRLILSCCVAATTIVYFFLPPSFLERAEENGLFYSIEAGVTTEAETLALLMFFWIFVFMLWKKDRTQQS